MKLDEYLAEFADADPQEALEILIELADELPPLSPEREGVSRPSGCRIQECQTPVDLWVDVQNGRVRLEADVPAQSPTVRGFVALLVNGLSGATPDEVRSLPADLVPRLNAAESLGMTRRHGFRGILARIKRDVSRAAET